MLSARTERDPQPAHLTRPHLHAGPDRRDVDTRRLAMALGGVGLNFAVWAAIIALAVMLLG